MTIRSSWLSGMIPPTNAPPTLETEAAQSVPPAPVCPTTVSSTTILVTPLEKVALLTVNGPILLPPEARTHVPAGKYETTLPETTKYPELPLPATAEAMLNEHPRAAAVFAIQTFPIS
jgi:hypothetical protein